MIRYLILSLVLVVASCAAPRTTATSTATAPAAPPTTTTVATASYVGTWDVTVSGTPAGTITGVMTLMEGEDGLTGTFGADGNTTNFRSVERTDDGLMIKFYSSEYQTDVDMKLTGDPAADTLEGSAMGSFPIKATRKM